ncbi:MAG: hypothetical protein ACREB8_04410 [Pseudolabrys sp.]
MTDYSREQRSGQAHVSPEDWVLALGTALLALILLGILPRLFW